MVTDDDLIKSITNSALWVAFYHVGEALMVLLGEYESHWFFTCRLLILDLFTSSRCG